MTYYIHLKEIKYIGNVFSERNLLPLYKDANGIYVYIFLEVSYFVPWSRFSQISILFKYDDVDIPICNICLHGTKWGY